MRMALLASNGRVSADENQNCHNCCHQVRFLRYSMFSAPGPSGELTAFPQTPSYCLLLYLNINGLRRGTEKILQWSWKVLEIFITKRVATLYFILPHVKPAFNVFVPAQTTILRSWL